jgi:mannose-6-phosphate isomerase-like protein (cupin superfamily)
VINIVEKIWGVEHWIVNDIYCAKILEITPGYQCSFHYHPQKRETFHVLEGVVRLEQRDIRWIPFDEFLEPGETRTIEPKTPHRFSSKDGAKILEISSHHSDSDVVRLAESGKIPDVASSGPTQLS